MFHTVNQRDSSKICGDYLCMPDAGGGAQQFAVTHSRGQCARTMRDHGAIMARSMRDPCAIHARSMRDPWRDPWRDQGTLPQTRNSCPMQRASAQRLRRCAYTLTRPDRSRCAISLRLLRVQRKPSANPAQTPHRAITPFQRMRCYAGAHRRGGGTRHRMLA